MLTRQTDSCDTQETRHTPSKHTFPKLHNAIWPGLVGKEAGTDHPPISLDRMLELTVAAKVNGQNSTESTLPVPSAHRSGCLRRRHPGDGRQDRLQGLDVGSLVAPWPGTVGGSAMGAGDRANFVLAVKKACRIAKILNKHGVRKYGMIRIDSADSPANWEATPRQHQEDRRDLPRSGQGRRRKRRRLAAEGEICWAGMHSWKNMLDLLERSRHARNGRFPGRPGPHLSLSAGLQRTRRPRPAQDEGYSQAEFDAAYKNMTDALRPWTIDFHVAQNDGTVHGTGRHDKTGRHCPADDPNGKLDIVKPPATGSRSRQPRHPAHLLGRLHVPQRHAGEPADLEHDPRHDDQSPRRPRMELAAKQE